MRLRLAQRGDAAAFCGLFNRLYRRRVDAAYFDWQFFATPFPSLLCLAEDDRGALIGTYGFHVLPAGQGGATVPVAMALDIMVAPEHQGRGVFRRLFQYAEEMVRRHRPAALLVMANARAEAVHVGGVGWQRIAAIPTCVVAATAASTSASASALMERFIDVVPTWIGQRAGRWAIERSAEYLDWRLIQNPWHRYQIHPIAGGGHLALKTFRDPESGRASGDLVDLLWRDDDPQVLAQALRAGLGALFAQGADEAAAWLMTGTLVDGVLQGLGFSPTNQHRYFCGRALVPAAASLLRADRWFLTMADAEIY
jgi:GNAT superfamily N-acetyltransferase